MIGKKGIEDALSKLDRLTQEEVNMATVQILKVSHHIDGGVNQLIEGTLSTLATQIFISNQKNVTRWKRNESSYGRRKTLVVLSSQLLILKYLDYRAPND